MQAGNPKRSLLWALRNGSWFWPNFRNQESTRAILESRGSSEALHGLANLFDSRTTLNTVVENSLKKLQKARDSEFILDSWWPESS